MLCFWISSCWLTLSCQISICMRVKDGTLVSRKQFNTSRIIELNLDLFLKVLSVFTSGNSLIGATFNVDRFSEHKILTAI